MLGSPVYMAPEQLADPRNVDERTDVWGIGTVLYQALTGQPPFDGSTLFELAGRVRDEAHVPASALRSDLPGGLSQIVDRCLAKTPEARWPKISMLAQALAPFAPEDTRVLIRSIAAMSTNSGAGMIPEPPSALSEQFLLEVLEAVTQLQDGHFTGFMWRNYPGLGGQVVQAFNEHLAFLKAYRDAHLQLTEQIGITGRLGGQMALPPEMPNWSGAWKRMGEATNSMASNLTDQFRDGSNVVTALLVGEHDARMTCQAIQGEFRVFRERLNALAQRKQDGRDSEG